MKVGLYNFQIQINMPSKCFICKGSTVGTIRFPENEGRRSVWLSSLQLTSLPSGDKRLCRKHFRKCDFNESSSSQLLKDTAVQTRELPHIALCSIFSEHSYSATNFSKEALIKSLIDLIYCLALLLLTFIGFLVYLL